MIRVTEIREKSEAGSIEFTPQNLSSEDAIKILVAKELGRGAIISDVSENQLITLAINADGTWDEVIFEGSGEEFKPLLNQAAYFTTAWLNNNELLKKVCSAEAKAVTPKTLPEVCLFAAPFSLAKPNGLQQLLGTGKRPDAQTLNISAKPVQIKKDGTAAFRMVIRTASPLADC